MFGADNLERIYSNPLYIKFKVTVKLRFWQRNVLIHTRVLKRNLLLTKKSNLNKSKEGGTVELEI